MLKIIIASLTNILDAMNSTRT